MMIGVFLLWAALVLAAVAVVRALFPRADSNTTGKDAVRSALAILAERYARGEIDAEHYAVMKDDLNLTERTGDS